MGLTIINKRDKQDTVISDDVINTYAFSVNKDYVDICICICFDKKTINLFFQCKKEK